MVPRVGGHNAKTFQKCSLGRYKSADVEGETGKSRAK